MSRSLHSWYGPSDLDRFAERGVELEGRLEIKQLSRLRDMLHTDAGQVQVKLSFGRGGAGWLHMSLEYRTTFWLVCQRCLEPLEFEADAKVELGLIESAGVAIPENFEPVVLENDRLRPAQLLEDELIVALPLVPKHRTVEECGQLARQLVDNGARATRDSH